MLQGSFHLVRSSRPTDPRVEDQKTSVRTQKDREFELSPSDMIWTGIIITIADGFLRVLW